MAPTPVQIGPPPPTPPPAPAAPSGRFGTQRLDPWWVRPAGTAMFLGLLTGYAVWAGLQTAHFAVGSYISPLYSPCVAADCGASANVVIIGNWWKLSPALWVMAVPIGVRATCYYYRKLYYRSFWLSPPACGVDEPHGAYTGESRFPLVLQNMHRYFWDLSVLVACMLTYDTVNSFRQPGGIGIGVGTALILGNTVAFWLYLLSCHACRHLAGGGLRSLAGRPFRRMTWRLTSRLNVRHGGFALLSLPLVMVTDAYIRLVSSGAFADPHITLFG